MKISLERQIECNGRKLRTKVEADADESNMILRMELLQTALDKAMPESNPKLLDIDIEVENESD